ncbi:hypothetical protein DFJ74DRAFT_38558 [Hyaloraphidium curvatum]|nr:hypothetical protein DFJ74DRAFT_38558 [Hyaloraphidium curvatum]
MKATTPPSLAERQYSGCSSYSKSTMGATAQLRCPAFGGSNPSRPLVPDHVRARLMPQPRCTPSTPAGPALQPRTGPRTSRTRPARGRPRPARPSPGPRAPPSACGRIPRPGTPARTRLRPTSRAPRRCRRTARASALRRRRTADAASPRRGCRGARPTRGRGRKRPGRPTVEAGAGRGRRPLGTGSAGTRWASRKEWLAGSRRSLPSAQERPGRCPGEAVSRVCCGSAQAPPRVRPRRGFRPSRRSARRRTPAQCRGAGARRRRRWPGAARGS